MIVDIGRLRTITIVGPIVFLLVLEAFSIFVLIPLLGSGAAVRMLIIFGILTAAVVPFSFWIFALIERQQRELREAVGRLGALNEQNERRSLQLAAVNSAIRSISGELDLNDVLGQIVETAAHLVNAQYGALGVADEQGRILQFITTGITPEQRTAIGPLPQGHGLLGALITEATPLRIPNIGADPRSHGFPPNHPPMTSLLGVPILFHGRPVGDLYLTDKVGASQFSDEDQEMVMLLANHAAVAIENARLYSELRRSHDRLQSWNEELEQKVAERTREIERYSKELTTRVLRAQEEERKRIARELHDDTGQQLSTLLINLDLLEPSIPADDPLLQAGFDRIRTLAQRTLDAVRTLSHDLRPTILDDFGLVAAIRWFGDEYTKTFGVPVRIEIKNVPEDLLTPEAELALFRVAQEALTNSGKYAQATETGVEMTGNNGCVTLTVTDNGRGFDPEAVSGPTRQGGLGLYGMRERIELLGGQFAVEAAPNRGTRVVAEVPVGDGENGGADGDGSV
jgi:signal transduction histidine kinase